MKFFSDIGRLETMLAHFHARLKNNMPLSDKDVFSEKRGMGRNPLYRSIRQKLAQGESLSSALSSIPGFPLSFLKIIKRGEDSGNPAAALEAVLKRYPLISRFRRHLRMMIAYTAAVLGFFVFFLLLNSYLFTETVQTVSEYAPVSVKGGFVLLAVMPGYGFVVAAILIMTAAYLVIRLGYGEGAIRFIIRRFPALKRTYHRVISLELAADTLYNLDLGLPLHKALAEAAEGVDDAVLYQALRRAVSAATQGQTIGKALASHPASADMPIAPVIAIGEESGSPRELLNGHAELLHWHLTHNLDREMRSVFRACIAACGLIVGLGIVYVWSAIIYTYSFVAVSP